jgi:hypothetical protein
MFPQTDIRFGSVDEMRRRGFRVTGKPDGRHGWFQVSEEESSVFSAQFSEKKKRYSPF